MNRSRANLGGAWTLGVGARHALGVVRGEGPACPTEGTIAAFVAGALQGAEFARVETHLAGCGSCQRVVGDTAAAVGSSIEPGDVLADRYRVEEPLGTGGAGQVFAAVHLELGHRVAIKVLHGISDLNARARFLREARTCARLVNDHVLRVFDFGRLPDGAPYIVMEYLVGEDLARVISRGRIPFAEAARYGVQVCEAMREAHGAGIVHRDIKPANLFLSTRSDGSRVLKVLDFGLSKFLGDDASDGVHTLTSAGTLLGSPLYMSPEQLQPGADVNERTDIWALGVTLYEMLGGSPPFRAATLAALATAIATHAPRPLSKVCPGLPAPLEAIVLRCLEKQPGARFSSARELAEALAPFAALAEPRRGRRHNLPAQTTPFVGRAAELAELARLLTDPQARIITILAPGGMGKSRLALEAARRVLDPRDASDPLAAAPFQDGVFVVQLAPLSSPELIVSSIAQAIGFQFYPGGEPKRQLFDYFHEKKLLLVLDDFERLLPGANVVGEVLQAAPGLKVLVTTRERLGLIGETVLGLDGLDFASSHRLEDVAHSSAGKLLIQSARLVRPAFELEPEDLPAASRICRLVQGMPLGLLLAASWLEALSLREIADEINQSLDLLRSELKEVPERQRSIQAVFDYAWSALDAEERAVFARLSVFRGGFTRDAALNVASASLPILLALLKKSLLRRSADSGRYELHELLRQYAEARLRETTPDLERALDRYDSYYAHFLRSRREALTGARPESTLHEITLEIDNVRAACMRLLQREELEELDSSLETLHLFYMHRSSFTAGRDIEEARTLFRTTAEALERAQGPASPKRSQLLGVALCLQAIYTVHEHSQQKLDLLEHAVALLRRSPRPRDLARALLARAACIGGHMPEAGLASAEEGLSLCRAEGDAFELATAHLCLGHVYQSVGDNVGSEAAFRESMSVQESLWARAGQPNEQATPWAALPLGSLLVRRGQLGEGRQLLSKALAASESSEKVFEQLLCLSALAEALIWQGDYELAEHYAERRLELAERLGSPMHVVLAQLQLGSLFLDTGQSARATDRCQQALAKSEAMQTPGSDLHVLQSVSLGALAEVERRLGNYAAAEAYARRRLSLPRRLWQEDLWSEFHLGDVLRDQGRFAEAEAHYHAACEQSGAVGAVRALAIGKLDLGDLALVREQGATAQAWLEASLSEFEGLGDASGAIQAIAGLSRCACLQQDYSLAAQQLGRVLRAAIDGTSLPKAANLVLATKALAVAALLAARTGEGERAVEFLALASAHPSTEHRARLDRIQPLLQELQAGLAPESFQAALERGRALELEAALRSALLGLGQ